MRSEWEELALKDVLEEIIDYRGKTPAKMGGDWSKTGYRVLSARHVKTGNIVREKEIRTVNQDVYDKWMQIEIEPGDIILTSEAPFGEAFYWDKDEKIVLGQRLYGLRANPSIIESRFLYYAITGYYFQKQLSARATGTTVRGLRQPELLKCTVSVPPLSTQKAIADTLSCLDAKIEVNNRIIKNLEEQAQAIFKSWFIDFEPFQEGEFVESKLGMIPEGWAVGTIDDIIELHDSKRVPLSSREREGMAKIYPYYGAASLMDYVDDYIFDGTYLLLGEDGTVVDDFGYPILQYVYGKIWVNNHAHVITGKNGYTVEHLYMLFRNTNVHSAVTGAVQKKINQRNLKSLQVILPPREIVGLYNDHIAPAFSLRKTLEQQNTTLATLRDTLLPKLMSGEIEVPIDQ